MMNIIFDSARNYLHGVLQTQDRLLLENLTKGISLLESIDLYISKCRRRRSSQGDAKPDSSRLSSISIQIQDLVREIIDGREPAELDLGVAVSKIHTFQKNMNLFFEANIKELDIINLLPYYSLGDPQLVMDFTDSLLHSVPGDIFFEPLSIIVEIVREKLMFLKSFICFATVQGVEDQPLIKLLDHVEVVAVSAASLATNFWCQVENFQSFPLIQNMIEPDDPRVKEIYTRVLEASKLSISSCTLALKENRHSVVEFIHYLLQNIIGMLSECYTNFPNKMKHQILKLFEGVRFLSTLLSPEQGKFEELNDEMKDLIGLAVSDVGIVAFTLSMNEMKEDLSRDKGPLSNLLQLLRFIIAEVAHIYPLTSSSSSFSFPRTNELGSLDFFLENLKELVTSKADSISSPNDQIHTIVEDLVFLRSFLGNSVKQRSKDEKLQALWSRVMNVAHTAELEIDCALLNDKHELYLDAVAEDIHLMKIEAEEIYDSIRYDGETQGVTKTTTNIPSQVTAPIFNEALVGRNDEVESIIDRLVRGSSQLDVVAIVGMPGLGKTSLANKVYGHPLVERRFHIRAWCCFSQTYSKHSLLAQILRSINHGNSIQYLEKNEDNMAEELRKLLKRQRYLIIFDDVWDIVGWDLLKDSLPNDCNGSRILLTSRFQKLSLQIKPDSEPHLLRQLTDNESNELLLKKLFVKEDCPPTLSEVVPHVAKYCKGLPLAIVIIAGILATTEQDCWEEVVRRLTSKIYADDKHCMMTIEQSYDCLPDYLKPCLLYFGAFKEDQDIPIREMLWLWISEGFVQKAEGRSLEDVANDYLMEMIGRSLVMATQQRSLGGLKACRIHDLVYEFCVTKGNVERFLHSLHEDDLLTFTRPFYPHRLSVHSSTTQGLMRSKMFFPNLRCLHLFGDNYVLSHENVFKFSFPKLLRVLDWSNSEWTNIPYGKFPKQVTFLVHLRYLRMNNISLVNIPSEIANLSRLETFVLSFLVNACFLPNTIWNIKTLRHLVSKHAKLAGCGFVFPIGNLEGSPDLEHLDTLTVAIDPTSQHFQKTLSKLPSIRRLTIAPTSDSASKSTRNHDGILVLNHFRRLEELKLCQFDGFDFEFPLNLKRLTLTNHRQPWSKISAIGKLPNLEVLKLYNDNSLGERWEMEEGEFSSLRFLKLSMLSIQCWTASSDNFSCLERLVLNECRWLEEVPSCLGESPTLDMIEVKLCKESVINSVEQIQQEQKDLGNEGLKVVIIKER